MMRRLVCFVGLMGMARSVLEIPWLFAMAGRWSDLALVLRSPLWYALEAAPFTAANVLTGYLRWVLYAVLALLLLWWWGHPARFRDLLRAFGWAMALYVVPGIVNWVYLVAPIPAIRFAVSPLYQPLIGVGQVVATVAFIGVTFRIFRQAGACSRSEAWLGALLIPLVDRTGYLVWAKGIFAWHPLMLLPAKLAFGVVTVGFILGGLLALPVLVWWGRRLSTETR